MSNNMLQTNTKVTKAFNLNHHIILIIGICILLMIPQIAFNSFLEQRQYGAYPSDFDYTYTLIERLTKYAFFIVLVVFTCIFIVESICNVYLTAIHFLVIGSALILFYLVLLALSEHIPFAYTYIIVALMITIMISLYLKALFKNNKAIVFMSLVLLAIYIILFAIVHAQNYALLVGTLILVMLLAAIMYVTAKLKTYSLAEKINNEIINKDN